MKEMERQTRIKKASSLKGTWDLMKVCKGFLEEWEIGWSGQRKQEIDKNDRFRRIEIKRKDQNRKNVQTRINFGVSQLGESGKKEWAA